MLQPDWTALYSAVGHSLYTQARPFPFSFAEAGLAHETKPEHPGIKLKTVVQVV